MKIIQCIVRFGNNYELTCCFLSCGELLLMKRRVVFHPTKRFLAPDYVVLRIRNNMYTYFLTL